MATFGRYLTAVERDYLRERKDVLSTLDQELIAENPFLFARRQIVAEMAARIELFKQILDVSGAIVECGVAQGNNLMLFSHLSSVFEPYAINRQIIGFDTFSGFRGISGNDPKDISEKGFSGVSPEVIERAIALYDMNRAAGHMARTEIVRGDARETIPRYAAEHPELTVALLYLDFDIYEPTKVALTHLLPLVCKGGLVVLDEFNYSKFAGETQALKELVDLRDIELRRFSFEPFIAYFRV